MTARRISSAKPALLLTLCAFVGLAGGAALGDVQRPKPRPDASMAQSAMPDSAAGAYLAARMALGQNDYAAATDWFDRALQLDPANADLLDGAVTVRLAVGDIAGAAKAARQVLTMGSKSQNAVLAVLAGDAVAGDFAAMKADLGDGHSIGELPDSLIQAWSELGQGKMSDALAAFDQSSAKAGNRGFALYHKALAMALVGDFEGAAKILSGPDIGQIRETRRAVVARVEVLAQLDRRAEALAALDLAFPAGQDPAMDALRARLKGTDPVAFDIITKPSDGVAEVLFDMAVALSGQADDNYVLLFTRVAAAIRPDHTEAVMLSAQLLQRIGQYDLATAAYALVPPTNPSFIDARIGEANAAIMAGNGDQAVTILSDLNTAQPGDMSIVQSLADALRRQSRFDEAVVQYNAAIALAGTPQPQDWTLFYARGICLSELKRLPESDADFRKALELNPGQPQVLNYLGYSYVDRGENLDEALKMIQQAVLAAPDQGYIVDSLAWALYRLGRVKEAVVPMERASMLEPVDSVVTDHLGDIYWAVGRKMEARFQWRRALSFNPSETDALRIRHKLDVGLDVLLQEEKAGKFPAPATPSAPAVPDGTAPDVTAPADGGNGG